MKIDVLKNFWQKAWWSKLILIVLGFFLWPFVIGGGISYFLASKIKNSLLRWILILPILGSSLLFGTVWVYAFVSPSQPKKEVAEGVIVPSPTPWVTEIPLMTPTLTLLLSPTQEPTSRVKGIQTEEVLVTRVIDGDTIEIEGGKKVRYIGIDTPETVDPRKSVQCFGLEASNKNKELVGGKKVRIEKDISEIDKYSRLLRYVWVGDIFVNDYLVRQGFAQSSTYPPDVKYQDQFLQAQKEARENSRGLWGKCDYFGQPFSISTAIPTSIPQSQSTKDSSIPSSQTSDCVIKGNISSKGEKIYHVPGCANYNSTVIDESKGEHFFCSETEAKSAGWRKALNCP